MTTNVEVCFIATDESSSPKQFADGMPVIVKSPGLYWNSVAMLAWFATNTPPADFTQLAAHRQDRLTQIMGRTRYFLDPKLDHSAAAALWFPGMPKQQALAQVAIEITDSQAVRDYWATEGLDTNWTAHVLKAARGYTLMELDAGEIESLAMSQLNTEPGEPDELAKRKYVLDYEPHFPAQTVTNWKTKGTKVLVDRAMTPLTWAQVVEEV